MQDQQREILSQVASGTITAAELEGGGREFLDGIGALGVGGARGGIDRVDLVEGEAGDHAVIALGRTGLQVPAEPKI